MSEDKGTIHEMNKRILIDLEKVDLDRLA